MIYDEGYVTSSMVVVGAPKVVQGCDNLCGLADLDKLQNL